MFRKISILLILFLMITAGVMAQAPEKQKELAGDCCFNDFPPPPMCYLAQADLDDSPATGPGPNGHFGRGRRNYMEAMDILTGPFRSLKKP